MAEQVSKKVTLRYPVNINSIEYPAGISLDLPVDIADQAQKLSDGRLEQELKRMEDHNSINSVPVGIDPLTGKPFRN